MEMRSNQEGHDEKDTTECALVPRLGGAKSPLFMLVEWSSDIFYGKAAFRTNVSLIWKHTLGATTTHSPEISKP